MNDSTSTVPTPPSGIDESSHIGRSRQQAAVIATCSRADSSTTNSVAAASGSGGGGRDESRETTSSSPTTVSSALNPPPSPQLLQVPLPATVCTPEQLDEWFDKTLKLQHPAVAPREFGHFGSKSHPWRTAARLCCAGNLQDPLCVRNPANLTKERATRIVRSALGPELCPPERIFSKDPFRAVAIALSLLSKVVVTPMRAFTFFDRGGNQLIHQSEDFMSFLGDHKIKWPPRRRQLEAEHSRLLAFESIIRKQQQPCSMSSSGSGAAAAAPMMRAEVKDEPMSFQRLALGPERPAGSSSLGDRQIRGVDLSPKGHKLRRLRTVSESDDTGDYSLLADEAGPTIPIRTYLSLKQAADPDGQHALSEPPSLSPLSERPFGVPVPPDDDNASRQKKLLQELQRDVTRDYLGGLVGGTSTLSQTMMATQAPATSLGSSFSWLHQPSNLMFSGAAIFQQSWPPAQMRYSYDGRTNPAIHPCEVRAEHQNLQHVSMPDMPLVGNDWQPPPQQQFDMSAERFQTFPSLSSDCQFLKGPDVSIHGESERS